MKTIPWIVAVILVSACGQSPTSPSPAPQPEHKVITEAPAAPTPEPEPAPTPTPVPPPPAPGFAFDGEVGNAYWFGKPLVPGHFDLTITPYRVEVTGYGFDILTAAPGNVYVIAGTRNVETLTIQFIEGGGWTWTYNGLAGQAYGTLRRR